jgi:hypothetical protein
MEDGPPSIIPALGVGLHDISEAAYHGDPCAEPSLSCSLAKTMIDESCRHSFYEHPRLGGRLVAKENPSKVMDFGSLGHKLLLGKGAEVAIGRWDDWKKQEARDFRDAAWKSGMIPTLPHIHESAEEMKAAGMDELVRLGIHDQFMAAKPEVAGIWKEGDIWMRSKYDKLLIDESAGIARIFDLKITERANPETIERQIGAMNYDLQRAMYPSGIEAIFPALAGRVEFTFLFFESQFPFSLVPVELNGEFQALGRMKFERAKKLWSMCRSTGEWPGYVSTSFRARPKPWDLAREAESVIPEFSVK